MSSWRAVWLPIILGAFCISPGYAGPRSSHYAPEFIPCAPTSEYSSLTNDGEPDPEFCADWNPDYAWNGHHCCAKPKAKRKRTANKCAPNRYRTSYCVEMTPEQKEYFDAATAGKVGDVLTLVSQEMGRKGEQAYCSVNNGFLAYGRPVLPSEINRVMLRSPKRCLNFGTDGMVGMLEWVGRQVGKQYATPEYSGVHLLVGDIAAPRGGCLWGRHGRRGHASHTSGQDVDIGFLTPLPKKDSPPNFHRQFDPKANWWAIKNFFKNPFACVKVIFLDRRLISKLAKVASREDGEDWAAYRRFIRHMPGHRNHFHVRIGEGPGTPGCAADARPELEFEESTDSTEAM